MINKAQTIEEIKKYCAPKPLSSEEELKQFYINTNNVRDPERNIFNLLKSSVTSEEENRILFCGHKGCGKSTELNYLKKELKDEIFAVSFSVKKECNIFTLNAEELLLVIAERLLYTVKEKGFKIRNKSLKPIYDYFAKETKLMESRSEAGMEAEIGLNAENSLFGKLIGLLVSAKAGVKTSVGVLKTKESALIKRPDKLLLEVNRLIEEIKKYIPKNKKLLIIVEDLDKINLSVARDIFINNYEYLKINASIIYTIPIFLFYAPDAQACKSNFDVSISLPMIKIKDVSGERNKEGFEIIKKIIKARLDESLITEDALDILVENTGGVLRHCFEVLQTASQMNSAKKPLETRHIEYGLNRLRDDLWMQIVDTADAISVDDLRKRLIEYYSIQNRGETIDPSPDKANQILLMSSALIEYINGEKRFVVNPLLDKKIERLKK